MKDIEFGEQFGSWFSPPGYDALLESFELDILVEESDQDYQGDTYTLFRGPNDMYGTLTFGWGSCSGCDSLEACNTKEEVTDLRNHLYEGIQWFTSLDDAKQSVADVPDTEWRWHEVAWRRFREKVAAYTAE
jgi:hypothetical protein